MSRSPRAAGTLTAKLTRELDQPAAATESIGAIIPAGQGSTFLPFSRFWFSRARETQDQDVGTTPRRTNPSSLALRIHDEGAQMAAGHNVVRVSRVGSEF